jgi:hypothetical protein
MTSMKVTKIEAAEVVSRHVVLAALRTNTKITMAMVEQQIAEFASSPDGTFGSQWAKLCNKKRAYRRAIEKLCVRNREDLIIQHPTKTQTVFLRNVVLAGGRNVSSNIRHSPSNAVVVSCRDQGWIAPYEGSSIVEETVPWAPWTITDAGSEAAFGIGDYRR